MDARQADGKECANEYIPQQASTLTAATTNELIKGLKRAASTLPLTRGNDVCVRGQPGRHINLILRGRDLGRISCTERHCLLYDET